MKKRTVKLFHCDGCDQMVETIDLFSVAGVLTHWCSDCQERAISQGLDSGDEFHRMEIYKRWIDIRTAQRDGQPVDFFKTTIEECLDHTEKHGYWKKGSVLEILAEGHFVQTPFAIYADVASPSFEEV